MRRQSPASRGESLHTAEHVFDFGPLTVEDAAVNDRRFLILSARDASRDVAVIHPRNFMRERKRRRDTAHLRDRQQNRSSMAMPAASPVNQSHNIHAITLGPEP